LYRLGRPHKSLMVAGVRALLQSTITRAGRKVTSVGWAVASAVVIVAVPVVLVTSSLNALFYNPDFYLQGQLRWAIGRTTEYTAEQLRPVNRALVDFFGSPTLPLPSALQDEGASRDVFNQREVGHMNDVRDIVRLVGRIGNLFLTLALAAVIGRFVARGRGAWRWAAGRLGAGAGLTIGVVVLFGALTMVDFEQLFLAFHEMSFSNDLWQLDPRTDNLIRFFPFEFWYDATVTVALRTVLSALVVGGAALIARRWLRGGIGERAVP
jgi:integral membrane protein (TIGR01906 family)